MIEIGKSVESTLEAAVKRTIQDLRDKGATVGFAESCTGGLLSSSLTKVAGVSDVFMGSLVTYANYIKADVLGVEGQILEKFGAVSAECARDMAEKALMLLKVNFAVSVTGIAGPSGGSSQKPVGMVFIAVSGINSAQEISTTIFQQDFSELKTREEIQKASVMAALKHLQQRLQN